MIQLPRWLDDVPAAVQRLTAPIQALGARISGTLGADSPLAETTRQLTETMRSIGQRRRAAEQTAEALAALSKRNVRDLTTTEVRCPGNELLVRVVRIPRHLPGAAHDTHLVIPKSGVTFWYPADKKRLPAGKAWFLDDQANFDVRCRCHRGLTLTMDQLRGESPPPPGIRVLGF